MENKIHLPVFMGSPIYRYELLTTSKQVVYKFVSTKTTPIEAINRIAIMFATKTQRLKLFCNGELIHRFNYSPNYSYKTIHSKMNHQSKTDIHE